MTDHPQRDYFERVEQGLCDAIRRGAHRPHRRGWGRMARASQSMSSAGPRPRLPLRLRAGFAFATGGLILAGVIVVLAVGLGSGTQQAFAGWTASPTTPANAQTANAEAQCTSKLKGIRHEEANPLTERRTTVAVDTRGPYTLSLRVHGKRHQAVCFNSTQESEPGGANGFSYSHAPMPAADEIGRLAGGITTVGTGSIAYTFTYGRAGTGVEKVTLLLADGKRVVTTTENGWYLAWWPGKSLPLAAAVTTASGTRKVHI